VSDLRQIKQKLIDEDRIEELLEAVGCEHIKREQRGLLVTAQLPEHFYSHNRRAVQVRLTDSLPCYIRNRADFNGDIFSLISYIHHNKRGEQIQKDLHNAKEFICKTFGWRQFLKGYKGVVVKDYTACLKEIIRGKKKRREIKPNPVLPESVLEPFYYCGNPLPYLDWVEEGISYETQVLYGIGFDLESKRVTIPLRNRFGQLVGVKGRIVKDEDDDRKYLYLYRCQNRYEWFNFHFALPYILTDRRVYIFEAEKSCMKCFSNGIFNTLAIGASDISDEQAQMIKQLGLDIEIILCYDKDKTVEEIRKQAEVFKGRKVFGMFDTKGLLKGKDSPIDRGIEVWNELVESCIYPISFKGIDKDKK
jgi:DNA primase